MSSRGQVDARQPSVACAFSHTLDSRGPLGARLAAWRSAPPAGHAQTRASKIICSLILPANIGGRARTRAIATPLRWAAAGVRARRSGSQGAPGRAGNEKNWHQIKAARTGLAGTKIIERFSARGPNQKQNKTFGGQQRDTADQCCWPMSCRHSS